MRKIHGAPDWSQIPVMPIDNLLWTEKVEITAQAQLCWDEENLYVCLAATEPNIRMKETGPLAVCCFDSCLEFFFKPDNNRKQYLNFEMNPNAALWVAYGTGKKDSVRLLPRKPRKLFDQQVTFTPHGWELTYRIPFEFIRRFFPGFAPKVGDSMRANAYKCGDKTVVPHYLAWNPIPYKHPAFHCPRHFGLVIFGGED